MRYMRAKPEYSVPPWAAVNGKDAALGAQVHQSVEGFQAVYGPFILKVNVLKNFIPSAI